MKEGKNALRRPSRALGESCKQAVDHRPGHILQLRRQLFLLELVVRRPPERHHCSDVEQELELTFAVLVAACRLRHHHLNSRVDPIGAAERQHLLALPWAACLVKRADGERLPLGLGDNPV